VPHSDFNLALSVAHETGKLLQSYHGKFTISHKGEKDLVTDADRAAEDFITEKLKHECPNDAIIAEEGTKIPGDSGRRWIVDPLDGTNNFAHGFVAFAVSIALIENGALKVGVVHAPALGKTFAAQAGAGATLNGNRIQVSRIATVGQAIAATGFPYERRTLARNNLAEFNRIMMEVQGIRRVGSAALDLCWVAAGRWDAYWELHLQPWDVAAGILICQEAGGTVTDLSGGPIDINRPEILATNGLLHEPMLALLS
jgi:myo-inositol-1(or 4)-monophosphatase